jgi:uncharacterized protein with PIN domain
MTHSQLLLPQRQELHPHRLHRHYQLDEIEAAEFMATSKLNADTPLCPNCQLPMVRIGSLPGIIDRSGVEVFRCPRCNAIITREF